MYTVREKKRANGSKHLNFMSYGIMLLSILSRKCNIINAENHLNCLGSQLKRTGAHQ
jgi:hypothetical protein